MEMSVGSTIEMIKLVEHENETKLKQKRETEETISSLTKVLKTTSSVTEKYIQEYAELKKKVNALKTDLIVEKCKRDALVSTLAAYTEELNNLKTKSDEGIQEVWNLRSNLCSKIQDTVDKYDVRALLAKPKFSDTVPSNSTKHCERSTVLLNEGRLKAAIERRDRAIAERNRLMLEPDNGEEFIRIKNALNFTKQRRAQLMEDSKNMETQ